MQWEVPPKIKVYEALGAIADQRIDCDGNSAKVFSSNRNKYYSVIYDPKKRAIMSNDNGSFFVGYLGYPAIALLMLKGVLPFSNFFSEALEGIAWKDINQKNENDFDKTLHQVHEVLKEKNINVEQLTSFVDTVIIEIKNEEFLFLGKKKAPPDR